MAEQTNEAKDNETSSGREAPARLRRIRAQLLRLAASCAEDPLQGQAEERLIKAAQELQVATVHLEAAQTPVS